MFIWYRVGWSGRFRRGNFNRWSPILFQLRISYFTCKTSPEPMGHNNGWFQTWFLRNSKNKNFLLFSLWICEKFQNFLLGYLPLKWKFSKNSFFIEFRIKFWFGKWSFLKFLIYDSKLMNRVLFLEHFQYWRSYFSTSFCGCHRLFNSK